MNLRAKLTYANVTATLALFLALTGVGYAAARIHGSQIAKRSIAGVKLKRNTITGREVRESRLGPVPRARKAGRAISAETAQTAVRAGDAGTLGGLTADQLRVRCPAVLIYTAGVCFETTPRSALAYKLAVLTCDETENRRLPTHGELLAFVSRGDVSVAAGGELTSDVGEPGTPTATRTLDVAVMTDDTGNTEFVNAGGNDGARAFRCVTPRAD